MLLKGSIEPESIHQVCFCHIITSDDHPFYTPWYTKGTNLVPGTVQAGVPQNGKLNLDLLYCNFDPLSGRLNGTTFPIHPSLNLKGNTLFYNSHGHNCCAVKISAQQIQFNFKK